MEKLCLVLKLFLETFGKNLVNNVSGSSSIVKFKSSSQFGKSCPRLAERLFYTNSVKNDSVNVLMVLSFAFGAILTPRHNILCISSGAALQNELDLLPAS